MLFARSNPALFISLANDENVQLRNFAIRAAEVRNYKAITRISVLLHGDQMIEN